MRNSEVIIISPAFGRDTGKILKITEMPALQAEKWAWRLICALKGTSIQVPEQFEKMGIIAIARQALNGFLAADVDYEKLSPLLDEMLTCVQIIRDTNHPEVVTPFDPMHDLEEIHTIPWLRSEVLRVHTGFSIAESIWTLVSAMVWGVPDSPST